MNAPPAASADSHASDTPIDSSAPHEPAARPVSLDRALARAWYGGMLGGLLPILLLGFLYSALADRTVFVLWALAAATAWVVVLRTGLEHAWPRGRRVASLAALLALALAWFALLETKHHEILDLGYRAVFYALYHPYATAPRTAWILAGVAALVAIAALVFSRRRTP
jgi:hypothetical protein